MTEKSSTPYNIREKKEKNAAYRSLIRAELADELYDKILNIVVIEKRYRDKEFSAKRPSQRVRNKYPLYIGSYQLSFQYQFFVPGKRVSC